VTVAGRRYHRVAQEVQMAGSIGEHTIERVTGRLILDSHLAWTPEFDIAFVGGGFGRGSAPRGETVSVFEGPAVERTEGVVAAATERLQGLAFTQASFDAHVDRLTPTWGKQVTLALSIAYFRASLSGSAAYAPQAQSPRLLLNILNGGMHAYTNPLTSDFPEFMLLARSDDLTGVADTYVGLLRVVRAKLKAYPLVDVGGNPVHDFGDSPNYAVLAFLRDLLRAEGLETAFGVAVDASAGDWWTNGGYWLPVSRQNLGSAELGAWWLSLVDEYGIELLEDPLGEYDREGWSRLYAERPPACRVLGDNYTSTDVTQLIGEGKARNLDGVLVKANQNGTISGTLAFAAEARAAGLAIVASHRSIETESTFLVELSRVMSADMLKIGPFADFSAVVKFNELLRLAEDAP
jgi:enolase